jgi:cell division control protein 7
VIVVQNKPRTTRELWEEHLLDGDELKSYHSGDSEDFLMNHRPPLERAGIKRDIKLFTESMSALSDAAGDKKDYQVVDRLGEGQSDIPGD